MIDASRYDPVTPPNQYPAGQGVRQSQSPSGATTTTTISTATILPSEFGTRYPEVFYSYDWQAVGGMFTLTGRIVTTVFDQSTRTTVLDSTSPAPATAPAGASGLLGSGTSSLVYVYSQSSPPPIPLNVRWSVTAHGVDAEVCLSSHLDLSLENEGYVCWLVDTAGTIKRYRTRWYDAEVTF